MVRSLAAGVILIISGLAASGQVPAPPQENVTAATSREVYSKFVKAFAKPTTMTGKIPRWETGICPLAVGQAAAFTAFITARVKAIAAAAGAPVNQSGSCTPNVEIVFTTAPQELLDNVRKHDPDYLGYAQSTTFRYELATVTRPIQAWYATETVDLDGMRRLDSARHVGNGIAMSNFSGIGGRHDPIYLPDANYARVTGNHINDGARSAFNHITIIVDTRRLAGQNFVRLADYVSVLALTQLDSLDGCQQPSSIVNMLASGCDSTVSGITAADLAFLSGLYGMAADKSLLLQQGDIADRMKQKLERQTPVAARDSQ